jgi:pimeloyl-ACP methyl ester carboxylesterase
MQLPLEAALDLPVDDGGVGPLPVVFLHALAGSAAQWSGQLENLRGQRRALALTLRGHAGAPVPVDGSYAIEALGADVVRTLDGLGITRFALAGHSAGAHVALAVAAGVPERVASLLLVDPAGDARAAPRPDALLAALDSPSYAPTIEQHYRALLVGARPPATQRVLADLRATPAATVVGVLRAMLAFDPLAALAAYPGPRLSVHTRFGEQPFSLHRLCPDLRSVRVGDSGHWLQLDRPKEFNLIVDGWLGAINPGRREMAAAAVR